MDKLRFILYASFNENAFDIILTSTVESRRDDGCDNFFNDIYLSLVPRSIDAPTELPCVRGLDFEYSGKNILSRCSWGIRVSGEL